MQPHTYYTCIFANVKGIIVLYTRAKVYDTQLIQNTFILWSRSHNPLNVLKGLSALFFVPFALVFANFVLVIIQVVLHKYSVQASNFNT